jgi:hypothetical protein
MGRWLSRDPIGEKGGVNILAFVDNSVTFAIDPVGLDKYVFDGKKICLVSDDFSECKQCWKGRSGKPLLDENGRIKRDNSGMPMFPEPTIDEQKRNSSGTLPAGRYSFSCLRNSDDPDKPGFWSREDWNKYDNERRWWERDIEGGRKPGPWGNWFVRLYALPGSETYGRTLFNIHGGRRADGGEWGSAGCIDLMCQDDDFFSALAKQCYTYSYLEEYVEYDYGDPLYPVPTKKTRVVTVTKATTELVVDYSGKLMPPSCREPIDPCASK